MIEGINEGSNFIDPRVKINEIWGRINQLGANDSERSEIESILERLENKDLKPAEAVEAAQKILDRKMDYH
jgi:hypothetical protein